MCAAGALTSAGCDLGLGPVSSRLPGTDECEMECAMHEWADVKLNMVVLTNRGDAPTSPSSFTGCTSTDDTWPCLHPNSLNEYFVDDAGAPVESPGSGDTVTFAYGSHADRDDLESVIDIADTGENPDCVRALELADTDDGLTLDEWKSELASAALNCPELSMNNPAFATVFLMDNPFGDDDSYNFHGELLECLPVNFVDVDRVLNATGLAMKSAVSEHEMGHGFGLEHVCQDDVPNSGGDASNIMHTTDLNCCCELEGVTPETESAFWVSDVCVECSDDLGAPASCDDAPAPDNDPDCEAPEFHVGARDLGFSDSEDAGQYATSPGQLEAIIDARVAMCQCACEDVVSKENASAHTTESAYTPPSCAAGSGRVALVTARSRDDNDDDTAFSELVPVLVSGSPLSEGAWITNVSVVGFGSTSRVVLPTRANGWAFQSGDPDALNVAGLESFHSGRTGGSISGGVSATGYLWGADGVDLTESFTPPLVDLEWGCTPGPAPDSFAHIRPADAYLLPLSQLAGSWTQDVVLRPDYAHGLLFVEMRGYARMFGVTPLTAGNSGRWNFSYDQDGVEFAGWVSPSGNPAGTTLNLHLDNASFQSWSLSNVDRNGLVAAP